MGDARDRALAEAVRAELAGIDPHRSCCRAAERAGLGPAATGRARSPVVARLAVRLSGPLEGRDQGFDWSTARRHCRSAWLRGRFLSVGSLSLGSGGVQLEFVLRTGEGRGLARRLEESGFPATCRVRRGRDVVTWKRIETILGFLRSCGAAASVLEIESRLVERQMHGHLNRVLNAETSNLQRSVASSARQVAFIERLITAGRLGEMNAVEQKVAHGRMEAPEASFSELSERVGVSRARVQRAFERLESAADASSGASDLS